ncbi:phospho-N-acetylmuramoyl-pentapeptide-transferase, partial [Stenotrophomonas maltophilia]
PSKTRQLAQSQGGEQIRKDGPQTHLSHARTPTKGGSLILLNITLSELIWADLRNRYLWLVLAVMQSFGAIGWY